MLIFCVHLFVDTVHHLSHKAQDRLAFLRSFIIILVVGFIQLGIIPHIVILSIGLIACLWVFMVTIGAINYCIYNQ